MEFEIYKYTYKYMTQETFFQYLFIYTLSLHVRKLRFKSSRGAVQIYNASVILSRIISTTLFIIWFAFRSMAMSHRTHFFPRECQRRGRGCL